MIAADRHGNTLAQEGCSRCVCGCKYWEKDRCIDCGAASAEELDVFLVIVATLLDPAFVAFASAALAANDE